MAEMTLAELATALGGELSGDGSQTVDGVADLEAAGPTHLAFVDSDKYLKLGLASAAGCLLVRPGVEVGDRGAIAFDQPRLAFARAIALLCPTPPVAPGVAPSAVVDPSAKLGVGVHVGPLSVIGAGVILGDRVVVGAGSVLADDVRIGADTELRPRVVVYAGTEIGARALVHAGAVLGSDGFGFVRSGDELVKFPQVGGLRIDDDVEIGANTTIDRGALGATVIGPSSKIDNLVQIAHNVTIGRACAVSAQTGIAGSSQVADGVTLGGQVGVADHVRIQEGAMVGAQAGIPTGKIIRRGQVVWGTPARPLDQIKVQIANVARLGDLKELVTTLTERVAALESLNSDDDDSSIPPAQPATE